MQAALWLAISAAVSVLLGIVFLMIFKYQPHAATQATIIAQVSHSCHLATLPDASAFEETGHFCSSTNDRC